MDPERDHDLPERVTRRWERSAEAACSSVPPRPSFAEIFPGKEELLAANHRAMTEFVTQRTGGRVQTGPFRGMRIATEGSSDYYTCAKLLGVYEQELHHVVSEVPAGDYRAIVNIGCGEGYYAVGLALVDTTIPVYAFDLDPDMIDAVRRNAMLNRIADRVIAWPGCSPATLVAIAERHGRLLVFCDCEGFETTLFSDPDVVAALTGSDIVVECHDAFDQRCTPTVFGALWDTHRIEIVYSGGRDPGSLAILSRMSDLQRWLAVCEHRPVLMNWLICRPRW